MSPLTFHPATALSVLAFTGIVLAVIVAFLSGVHHAYADSNSTGRAAAVTRRIGAATALWLGLLCFLVGSGRLAALPFAGLPFFFGSVAAVSLFVGLSPLGGQLAAGIPVTALVAFQCFRLPLELVLHSWAAQGTIPATMTWTGQNWDIVSGIVAVLAFPLAARHRSAGWAANLIGFALLLNVIRVAVLSSPVPFGWHLDRPLLLALHLPYALIGPVCVGGALIGHLVLTRALLRR